MAQAHTQYINILTKALHRLHEAYPHQQIELQIKETEPNGWQCFIEFTEGGVKLGASESFFINPPEARR